MDNRSKINFKTPGGLKIRLNHRYFFYQLVKPDRYYTEEEIVSNDTMYNATSNIESMFIIPTMLIQTFSIFAIIFHMSIPVFCISSFALFLFGCIWRCSKQDLVLSTVLMFLATMYRMFSWLFYIALIVLTFVFGCTYLILPYVIMRIVFFVFEMIENHLVLTITKKKYGFAFGDTEICAFRVFHLLSMSTLKMSDYIRLYISTIYCDESPTDTKIETMDYEQYSLFDDIE